MFTTPRVNVVESDEGFSVEVLGRTGLKYVQGDQTLFVDSEVLAGHAAMVICARCIKEWDSKKPIDEGTRKTIVDNIRRALEWDGAVVYVQE